MAAEHRYKLLVGAKAPKRKADPEQPAEEDDKAVAPKAKGKPKASSKKSAKKAE